MSKQMTRSLNPDFSLFHETCDPVAQIGWAQPHAVAAEEHGGFIWQVVKEWAGLGQEAVEPEGGPFAHRQQAALVVFAMADEQRAGGRIVIAVIEFGHFGAPDAGGVEEFEDGAVAQAERVGPVGQG